MADTTTWMGYATIPQKPGPRPTPPPAPPTQPDPAPQPNPQPNPQRNPEPDPTTTRRQESPASTITRGERPYQTNDPPSLEPEVISAEATTTTDTTTTTRDDGGGGGDPTTVPIVQTSPPSAQRTNSSASRSGGPGPAPSGVQVNPPAGITFIPGSPTAYRTSGDATSATATAISGSVISGPMTGVVFAFAFLGALVIGLVAGFLIAKYTHLGGGGSGRPRRQQRDDLTEQLRLLTDTLGQCNNNNNNNNNNNSNNNIHDCYFDNPSQQHQFRYDRSYLNDEKLGHESATANNQAEAMPLYMYNRQSVASTVTGTTGGGDAETDRLRPHSVPDHNRYQDWDLVGTPLMSPNPTGLITTTAVANQPGGGGRVESGAFLNPRVVHLPPTQLPPDVEICSPKGEWYHPSSSAVVTGGGGGGGNMSRTSVTDSSEFERRRPQIQEEGEGEDSLFGIGNQTNNPHVTAIME
ncbi:hypothetical protein BGW39_003932 [Mortierella sp. 14UC]|nr:hypothetical protein BGW39_003932 [Mortierella sp. 14UC]